MIDIIDTMRKGYAVYWAPVKDASGNVVPDNFGNPSYLAPVQFTPEDGSGVFWEASTDIYMDAKGQQRVSKAKVFVGQDVTELGFLWEGLLTDIPNSLRSTPKKLYKAAEIMRFDKIPTLDYDQWLRKVYL